ncbi:MULTISPECIES: amino acid ABC transporter ATP-binding protein [Bacillaceae]|uniref:amino acid ABC transporter ATP-binding protein n=1 Tax=Bacillaceae TaxID=186817 RepID=UPI00068C66D5|nr:MULTISPECIES: amino acid ABC transporter ATP-binding protein [Bacillaceae]MBI0579873.1 amino acid ABC transporter ATP-binding protein [Neobacillus cucumis]
MIADNTEQISNESPLLRVKSLKAILGNKEVLRGIDLDVKKGEKVTILGPSGSGKSTLLRCINLLVPKSEGDMYFDGHLINQMDQKSSILLRKEIGMVFQHFNLWPHLKILRNVALPPERVLKMSREEAESLALELLKKVGLESFVDSYPDQLSGGQKQRVAIARALAMQPKLMLFDEPTSALDPELVREVLQVIEQVANDGMTIVIVTHEMKFAQRVSNRILFMDDGNIVEDNTPENFFQHPSTNRAQEFLKDILWN